MSGYEDLDYIKKTYIPNLETGIIRSWLTRLFKTTTQDEQSKILQQGVMYELDRELKNRNLTFEEDESMVEED
jgi:hypothetical protein